MQSRKLSLMSSSVTAIAFAFTMDAHAATLAHSLGLWERAAGLGDAGESADREVGMAAQICRTIGPSLVEPLADALAAEDNARTVRRLRDILIGFGSAARQYADELRTSPNPAVRRAAVDLLRALGGEAALPDLCGLLDDGEPQVQREALRAIVQIGTDEAYGALEQALKNGKPHTREAILQALGSLRDERAAPLFVHLLTHTGYTGALEADYISNIESLGRVANDERSVSALKVILYRGEWYAPGRTTRIRTAAARALRTINLPSAERALNEAADGKVGNIVDSVMLYCFKYDRHQSKYGLVVFNIMKIAGAITVLALALWLIPVMIRARRENV